MRRLLPVLALLMLLPLLTPTASAFSSHAEVDARMRELDQHARVHVLEAGVSEEGRAVWAAVVADPPVTAPADVGTRAVTLLYTQQHGNEPAGTPAALQIIEDLTGDLGDDVLADQVVVVVPMVNPDGAEAGTRGNSDGVDTNRDHMNVTTATARLVHDLVHAWEPVVVVDHHEYSGTGTGLGPIRTYDYDATILWPRHVNVDDAVVDLSKDVNDAMRAHIESEGYTTGDYGTLTVHGVPVQQLAGGPTPNIARNHYGLHHAASLLVESRVDPQEQEQLFDGPERRTRVHHLAMEATVHHVAAHAAEMLAVRDDARARALAAPLKFDHPPGEGAFPGFGYAVDDAALRDTLAHHHVIVADGVALVDQPLRHHVGLLLHPESMWRIGSATEVAEAPEVDGTEDAPDTQAVPGPAGFLVATLAAAVALAYRSRIRSQ